MIKWLERFFGTTPMMIHKIAPYVLCIIVNSSMLELSYQFQTVHDDSFNNNVQFIKRNNCITITRKSVRLFRNIMKFSFESFYTNNTVRVIN